MVPGGFLMRFPSKDPAAGDSGSYAAARKQEDGALRLERTQSWARTA